MKKFIGVIGVALIAVAMFSITNSGINKNSNLDLTSLISLNKANAEFSILPDCVCKESTSSCVDGGWVSFRGICDYYIPGGGNDQLTCDIAFPNGC